MHPEILIKRNNWTNKDVLKSLEAGGKKRNRIAGGWIHDLCATRKVVLLCPPCKPKFDPKKLGYIEEKEFPKIQGKCDGCNTLDMYCKAYFWEEDYFLVRSTADERRALNRSRAKRIKQGKL